MPVIFFILMIFAQISNLVLQFSTKICIINTIMTRIFKTSLVLIVLLLCSVFLPRVLDAINNEPLSHRMFSDTEQISADNSQSDGNGQNNPQDDINENDNSLTSASGQENPQNLAAEQHNPQSDENEQGDPQSGFDEQDVPLGTINGQGNPGGVVKQPPQKSELEIVREEFFNVVDEFYQLLVPFKPYYIFESYQYNDAFYRAMATSADIELYNQAIELANLANNIIKNTDTSALTEPSVEFSLIGSDLNDGENTRIFIELSSKFYDICEIAQKLGF